ncbi:FtsX-like permease family protein [Spirosomataceae bacterium TFI 002]|nr:FtsX-like permease family protein [Spirosomataceae bacterium TFI 002]
MLKNYIKIAFRNTLKNKSTFAINLAGLSTGIACVIMIFLWVNDELKVDKFHKNDQQLYQVMEVMDANGAISVNPDTQGLLAETIVKDLPEVEKATTFFSLVNEGYDFNLTTPDNKIVKAGAIFADKPFFEIFSYPLIEGNASQVFNDKESVVISQSLAKKMFGSTDVLGKTIDCKFFGMGVLAKVTGVMEDVPENSTMKFDFVLTKGTLFDMVPNFKEWSNEGTNTFLTLKSGTDIDAFNAKIKNFVHAYSKDTRFTLFVRPYSSAYLYGSYENGQQAGGRIAYVKLFFIIGLFILIIACINFINLSTATASKREKEIGIKKAVGSSRRSLIAQFLTESVITVFISLVIALVLVQILLPQFNNITGKSIIFQLSTNNILILLCGALITGIISGYYPAFYLSGINTIGILKGKVKTSFSELLARKGLVVFQFAVSLFLIVAVLAVYKQVQFIQNMNLGYDKENILYIERDGGLMENSEAFLNQIKALPEVLNASSIQGAIAQEGDNSNTSGLSWEGSEPNIDVVFSIKTVDYNLIETLNIDMAEGRSFSSDFGAEGDKLIFNETAIKAMGLQNPIGKKVNMWGEEKIIVGITKDFFANSVHEKIRPTLFRYSPERTSQVVIKIAPGKNAEAISKLNEIYAEFNPGYPFNYTFMDDNFQKLYTSERRVATLSKYFAGLAILISCLGLFGLAMFNAQQRAKEISVRKVLGASINTVVIMLSKDFIKLALVAVLIAFPLSWYGINSWLNKYAYKTDIDFSIYAISFFSIIAITILTVSYQAIKAALVNPVENLKD